MAAKKPDGRSKRAAATKAAVDRGTSSAKRAPAKRAGGSSGKRTGASPPSPDDSKRGQAQPPRGRDEIIESVIDATLSLWASQGPATLSLRGIASRAGVNYGLVYRHFGTKDAVIRAAMNRRLENGLEIIRGCDNLKDVMDVFLDRSTGSYARLLAWATLQYVLEDILPPHDLVLQHVLDIAASERPGRDEHKRAVLVGSLIAMSYGWRLFESYLVPELGLESLSRAELDSRIREVMASMLSSEPLG